MGLEVSRVFLFCLFCCFLLVCLDLTLFSSVQYFSFMFSKVFSGSFSCLDTNSYFSFSFIILHIYCFPLFIFILLLCSQMTYLLFCVPVFKGPAVLCIATLLFLSVWLDVVLFFHLGILWLFVISEFILIYAYECKTYI